MATEIDVRRYQGGIADRRRCLPTSIVTAAMHYETCIEMREPYELHEELVRHLQRRGTDEAALAVCVSAAANYLASPRSRFTSQLVAEMARLATKDEIKSELHVLVNSFPNATKVDLRIYGRALALDVIDIEPTIEAVIVGCMTMRRRSKFLPTISEALGWIGVIDDHVRRERVVLSELPSLVEQGRQTCAA
jgi:hypothetical protein